MIPALLLTVTSTVFPPSTFYQLPSEVRAEVLCVMERRAGAEEGYVCTREERELWALSNELAGKLAVGELDDLTAPVTAQEPAQPLIDIQLGNWPLVVGIAIVAAAGAFGVGYFLGAD